MPRPNLGDIFPNFEADTTQGRIKLHDFLGDSWGILLSHPRDFTPVCTTELGRLVQLESEFWKRHIKVIALSCDTTRDHKEWAKDLLCFSNGKSFVPFPTIDDSSRKIAKELGMIDPDESDLTGVPLTCRAVFIIGPDKKLKLSLLYPATTGRNFDEILRVVDSLQLTANHSVATPVDWKSGEKCMVLPSIKTEDAIKKFPKGVSIQPVPSGKEYLRYTPDPR